MKNTFDIFFSSECQLFLSTLLKSTPIFLIYFLQNFKLTHQLYYCCFFPHQKKNCQSISTYHVQEERETKSSSCTKGNKIHRFSSRKTVTSTLLIRFCITILFHSLKTSIGNKIIEHIRHFSFAMNFTRSIESPRLKRRPR